MENAHSQGHTFNNYFNRNIKCNSIWILNKELYILQCRDRRID